MKSVLVDTNALVSFITDRAPAQQALVEQMFEDAMAGRLEIVAHQLVLAETVFVLKRLYQHPADRIAAILSDLLRMPGVRPGQDLSWSRLLHLWPRQISEFTEAAIAAIATERDVDSVATFDDDLRRQLRRLGIALHFDS